jgi:hypothetical protein
VPPFDDRFVGVNQVSSSRRDDKRGYAETVSIGIASDDGCCYDDDGYSYRFDQDGFIAIQRLAYRYGDGRDVRFSRVELELRDQRVR